jgi:hypothetical protein
MALGESKSVYCVGTHVMVRKLSLRALARERKDIIIQKHNTVDI